MSLDKLDNEIISLLKNDSRTSFEQIAKELNTTRQTIHNRIKILRDNKIILHRNSLLKLLRTCFVT